MGTIFRNIKMEEGKDFFYNGQLCVFKSVSDKGYNLFSKKDDKRMLARNLYVRKDSEPMTFLIPLSMRLFPALPNDGEPRIDFSKYAGTYTLEGAQKVVEDMRKVIEDFELEQKTKQK